MLTKQESGVTPILNPGYGLLLEQQKRPDLPWSPVPSIPERDEFQDNVLGLEWNFLRTPRYHWYEIEDGKLKIELRPETVTELVNPSYVAQRTRDVSYSATTQLSFHAKAANEKAGLVIYRRHGNNYQLLKEPNNIVLIKTFQEGNKGEFEPEIVASAPYNNKDVIFSVKVTKLEAQFFYGENEDNLKPMGDAQDYTLVSDEVAQRFNGVYVGMYATANGKKSKNAAEFNWFEYKGE